MTIMDAEPPGRHRVAETLHLLVAALAAIVIAIASQGWPGSSETSCDRVDACPVEVGGEPRIA